jgi:hypothetical protein
MLCGDSLFAVIIFAVVALFLVNLGASVWRNMVFQQGIEEKASVRRTKAVGSVLAKAAESLMGANELSMLRRTVAETALEHGMRTCRIILPNGAILADADPASITLIELPVSWDGEVPAYAEEFARRTARFSVPADGPGQGQRHVEDRGGRR